MADIFISYSSKDREKAEQLAELLASAGLSVWIDKQGIGAATSWSEEIVKALDDCKAFVIMLSPTSIESKNVVRELALAFEKNKRILPLDLEPVTLPASMQYHLAGLQRTSMTNIDSIIRALGKLGLEATQAPTLTLVKETDSRKSLMVLPFEDLSPTADNGWFADGIVNELVSALSNVKSIRITDQQTTKEYKNYKGHLTTYAKEMSIRYFVQGDVRKFGDQIKISCTLLDIETGDHLWQDSLKGTMDDIFDIQEKVAQKVVEGLKIHLAPDEKKKLAERGTENAEAYELWLKGNEYFTRHTKIDYERALALYEESIRLDPNFARAHSGLAGVSQEMYRNYSHNTLFLDRADESADRIREIEGETAQYAWTKSHISRNRGDLESALSYAKRCIEIDPHYVKGYDALGFAYSSLGDLEGAVATRKEQVRLGDASNSATMNLLIALNRLPDTPENREELRKSAERALPVFERHIRLNPDDYHFHVALIGTLERASQTERALQEADKLFTLDSLDAAASYNLACFYVRASDTVRGLSMLRRSIDKGFKNIEDFRQDPDLDPLRGTPEFEEMVKELQEKIEQQKVRIRN